MKSRGLSMALLLGEVVVTCVLGGLVTSCASPRKFAGKRVEIGLASDPPNATAFVLDNRRWMADKWPARIAELKAFQRDASTDAEACLARILLDLEQYRVKASRTPVRHTVPQWANVFVAALGARVEFTEFNGMSLAARPEGERRVQIQFPEEAPVP